RIRTAATARRAHGARTWRGSVRPAATSRRTARSRAGRSPPARPSSRQQAEAPPRPRPARAGRSSFVLGEPREDRLARAPPLLSDLASRELALLGEVDQRLLVDLQQRRELGRREDLELRRRQERVLADAPS